jgi:DNA-binding PadR family transcriptional regulator
VKNVIGPNEALILAALEGGDELSVAEVAERLGRVDVGRPIDDASIFVALQRMTERGFVSSSKRSVTSRDGRSRSVRCYVILAEGQRAVRQFQREAAGVNGLVGRRASRLLTLVKGAGR